MERPFVNIDVVKKVAHALGDLNNKVAYVGGAVVSFYADDPAADEARPTKDIDITLEIVSFAELAKLQSELSKRGFQPAPDEKVICRFHFEDILVDVMSTHAVGCAPSGMWFKPGFSHLLKIEPDKGLTIQLLSLPYFLATKFEAFKDRGKGESRTSRDFEDIIYVLDNRINLVDEIIHSPVDVRTFLTSEFEKLLQPASEEGILCHLNPITQVQRFELLKDKLKQIISKRGK